MLTFQQSGSLLSSVLERLASARQLGWAGLAGRIGWRLGMARLVSAFFVYRRYSPGLAGSAWVPGDIMPPAFVAGFAELKELLRHARLAGADQERIRLQADRALAGQTHVRGHGLRTLRLVENDWYHYDAALAIMINRHDFLIPLCQAFLLTHDERYLEKLRALLIYWCRNFDLARLIARDTPLDAAIRLLNWVWMWQIRALRLPAGDARRLKRVLFQQLEYIRAWHSAGGNHLVVEALCLFVYGVLFGNTRCARRWRRWGWQILCAEIERQVSADGVHSEQSTFYHQAVATHFLKAFLTARRNGIEVPKVFGSRLRKMLRVVHDTVKPDLTHPVLGDGEPMTTDDREHWEAKMLIPASGLLFGDLVCDRHVALGNDTSLWFLGIPAEQTPVTLREPVSITYRESGLAILRQSGCYVLMDAAPFGDRHFPHHGHADALNVEICAAGRSLIADPGGYGYYDDAYRRYFRSTRAHSTLRVDGRDQSELFGVLGYGRLAEVKLESCELQGWPQKISAVHDGYRPLRHRREIYLHGVDSPFFVIVDWLLGADGWHTVESLFQLAPGIDVDLRRDCLFEASGGRVFPWRWVANQPLAPSRAFGIDGAEPLGWHSPETGRRAPIAVLILSGRVRTPFVAATALWSADCQAQACLSDDGVLHVGDDDCWLRLHLDSAAGCSWVLDRSADLPLEPGRSAGMIRQPTGAMA